MSKSPTSRRFNITEIARSFPEKAETLLLDKYLTNEEAASARVFRVYRPTPLHFHVNSDEYLYVVSGRGSFWMEDASNVAEFAPGQLVFFTRGTVHAQPTILEGPVVFLSIDTPRRDPKDIGGKPAVHVHGVVALPTGETRGGHMLEAYVFPTLELFLTSWPEPLVKERDAETGLPLVDLHTHA
jgi:mannose-6-phosphate isomerase-like protein (cupin superfamily)